MSHKEYFERFFEEKDLPYVSWELTAPNGTIHHLIDTEIVIEAIMNASEKEQDHIHRALVKLDFLNADIVDYLKYLAQLLVDDF